MRLTITDNPGSRSRDMIIELARDTQLKEYNENDADWKPWKEIPISKPIDKSYNKSELKEEIAGVYEKFDNEIDRLRFQVNSQEFIRKVLQHDRFRLQDELPLGCKLWFWKILSFSTLLICEYL